MKPLCVVVLDTMHVGCCGAGAGEKAPAYFRINPYNHSGKRLYGLVDERHWKMLVTNSCPTVLNGPNDHGKPSPIFLEASLATIIKRFGEIRLLMVCGNVAQLTYGQTSYRKSYEGIKYMMYTLHPAARTWTREMLDDVRRRVAGHLP